VFDAGDQVANRWRIKLGEAKELHWGTWGDEEVPEILLAA